MLAEQVGMRSCSCIVEANIVNRSLRSISCLASTGTVPKMERRYRMSASTLKYIIENVCILGLYRGHGSSRFVLETRSVRSTCRQKATWFRTPARERRKFERARVNNPKAYIHDIGFTPTSLKKSVVLLCGCDSGGWSHPCSDRQQLAGIELH